MKNTDYRKITQTLCALGAAAAVGATLFATVAAAADSVPVRAAWFEDAYNITGKNGQKSGYGYEFQQTIAAYTDWTYDYVKAGWPELLKMVQQGDVDLMAGVSYTEERAKTLLYSDLPMGTEKYYLYADLTNTGITTSDLTSLNGRRVGILEGSIHETFFLRWEKEHNLHLTHVPMTSFEDAMGKIARREIDCLVSAETPDLVKAGMSAIALTGSSGIYFVVNKARPDLKAALDRAMRQLAYDKPFYDEELYQRYLAAPSLPVITADEKAWLKRHGPIRIGWLTDDAGFSQADAKTGERVGVINDYMREVPLRLGEPLLTFDPVKFESQDALIEGLKNRSIDMIFHMNRNPSAAEENGFWLSDTVLRGPLAAMTAQDYFNENAENRVAVEKANRFLKWHIAYYYPTWDIVEAETFQAAEMSVRAGRADCVLVKSGQLSQYAEDLKLHPVFLTRPGDTAFAVNRGEAVLLGILNKTLKTASPQMFNGALSMYENARPDVTVKDFVKANLTMVAGVSAAVVLLVMSLILGLLKKSRAAEARAREANAAKTSFLFNMSHDIRTPMNALLGYSRMIKHELTDPRLRSYQEKMEQSGKLLLAIINNVLDMARIESGRMELDENYCRADELVTDIGDVFEQEAEAKGLQLTVKTAMTHPHVICDSTKVKEILANLVSNAVKYTPEGGRVTVVCRELACARDGFARFETTVTDTGIGISREYLPRLFEPFTRERNTTAGKIAGTGLGMTIVKKLVDWLGGEMTVESELGRGSRFTVVLDLKMADPVYYRPKSAAADERPDQRRLAGKRILMAEDNDLNAEIAVYTLEKMGLTVDRVEDGVACVSRMEAEPAGTYDLILMDIQMPQMDGYKATQVIRAFKDEAKARIPIVAMTANAFEEDRQNALSCGMNGHIAKPLDAEKVAETLVKLLA